MAYTATILETRAWIIDPTNPTGPQVVCGSVQSSNTESNLDGEVRYYAGNRAQGVVRDQDADTIPITLVHVSYVQLNQLKLWRGVTLLYRAVDGTRAFVVFFNLSHARVMRTTPDDVTDPALVTHRVDLAMTRVSYPETV